MFLSRPVSVNNWSSDLAIKDFFPARSYPEYLDFFSLFFFSQIVFFLKCPSSLDWMYSRFKHPAKWLSLRRRRPQPKKSDNPNFISNLTINPLDFNPLFACCPGKAASADNNNKKEELVFFPLLLPFHLNLFFCCELSRPSNCMHHLPFYPSSFSSSSFLLSFFLSSPSLFSSSLT